MFGDKSLCGDLLSDICLKLTNGKVSLPYLVIVGILMIIFIEQNKLLSFVSELLVTTGSLLQSVWFQGAVY